MASEWMAGTNDWLALSNGIRMDERGEWTVNLNKWCLKRIVGFKIMVDCKKLVHLYVLQAVYTKYMKKL